MTKQNIVDKRASNYECGFILCNDTFLSGWGQADGGTSFYALAVCDPQEAETVMENAEARSDMENPRFVHDITNLRAKVFKNDQLTIVDRDEASRWYQPGGFA